MSTTTPEVLRPAEVCAMLKVEPGTLRWWRHIGHGPRFFRLSERVVRYRLSDVQEWLDNRYSLAIDSSYTPVEIDPLYA